MIQSIAKNDEQLEPISDRAAANLPHPNEKPDSDVLIFDGNCKFCHQQVQRLKRWDARERLSFVSLHDPYVTEHFPDLTFEQLMEQLYVVDLTGNRYGGAAAIRYLSRKLPRLWWLMPLMHIPFSLPIWQWGYKQVAKRRYKISRKIESCDDGSCEVHF